MASPLGLAQVPNTPAPPPVIDHGCRPRRADGQCQGRWRRRPVGGDTPGPRRRPRDAARAHRHARRAAGRDAPRRRRRRHGRQRRWGGHVGQRGGRHGQGWAVPLVVSIATESRQQQLQPPSHPGSSSSGVQRRQQARLSIAVQLMMEMASEASSRLLRLSAGGGNGYKERKELFMVTR